MGCVAIHSHFLFGLLTIYVVIVIFLSTTGLYDLSPKPQSAYNYGVVTNEIDLEGFKVLTSIIVHTLCALCLVVSMMANNITRCAKVLPPIVIIIILFFNMIFNLAGCLCLWIHQAPNFPEGYAYSIRGTATLSSFAIVYTLVAAIIYCVKFPQHPGLDVTLRALENKSQKGAKTSPKEGANEQGSKEGSKEPVQPLGAVPAGGEIRGSKEKLAATQLGDDTGNPSFDSKSHEGKSAEARGSRDKDQNTPEKSPDKVTNKTQDQTKSHQSYDFKTLQPTMEATIPEKDYFAY
ncbi:hypothetical protein Aduo_010975 [Ancylostoma duodenale]